MGVVWGVPVRPDRLGHALSAFAAKMKPKYPPLQRFLKYAEKPENECSKLPPEILKMISDFVIHSESGSSQSDLEVEDRWLQGYLCSQSACRRCQHVTDDVIKAYAREYDKEFGMDNFDIGDPFPWEEDSNWGRDPNERCTHSDRDPDTSRSSAESSEDGSEPKLTAIQQEFLDDRANSEWPGHRGGGTRVNDPYYKEEITNWILDASESENELDREHDKIIEKWLALFDQSPGGNFARLDKVRSCFLGTYLALGLTLIRDQVLKEFFQLEAFISIKPLDDDDDGSQQEESFRQYSCQAYLHLPTKFVSLGVHAHSAQLIRPEMVQSLSNAERKLFTTALADLHLDVDVHPMSFGPEISSDQRQEGLPQDDEKTKEMRAKSLEGMQWPMLIQVMKRVDGEDD